MVASTDNYVASIGLLSCIIFVDERHFADSLPHPRQTTPVESDQCSPEVTHTRLTAQEYVSLLQDLIKMQVGLLA